jgi:hypothetical protein
MARMWRRSRMGSAGFGVGMMVTSIRYISTVIIQLCNTEKQVYLCDDIQMRLEEGNQQVASVT